VIVVALGGGVGNQLFQYAAARALALTLGVPLALDARHYEGRGWPRYALDDFAIETVPVDRGALPLRDHRPIRRLLGRLGLGAGAFSVYREKGLAYDPAVLARPDRTYLRGNFPSERYFIGHELTIRRELAFVRPLDDDNRAVLDEIAGGIAVSLHIRRGDYVSNPRANRVHGTVNLDFYRRAADHIAGRAGGDPTFFVFSDDPDWVAANLALPYPAHAVTHNGADRDTEDLRLMAACRHHIVANSTFSWWGAWLNPSPDKIVVAPKPWFRDPSKDESTLVPEGWVRIDNAP
jgi:Glycosyl transferase family 11